MGCVMIVWDVWDSFSVNYSYACSKLCSFNIYMLPHRLYLKNNDDLEGERVGWLPRSVLNELQLGDWGLVSAKLLNCKIAELQNSQIAQKIQCQVRHGHWLCWLLDGQLVPGQEHGGLPSTHGRSVELNCPGSEWYLQIRIRRHKKMCRIRDELWWGYLRPHDLDWGVA